MADPTGPRVDDSASDEQLARAYQGGQTDALERLVRRYRSDLFPFLHRFVGQRAAAEDLFQETFIQVHQSIDRFDPSKRFKPWLFTIGANKARDHLRRTKRQQTVPLSASVEGSDDESPSFVDLMEGDVPPPESVAEVRETEDRVQEAVDQLPDHLREVLVLAYFDQEPYKQIAETLGVPLGTVKSRLHSAVATFSELWRAKYQADEFPTRMNQSGS